MSVIDIVQSHHSDPTENLKIRVSTGGSPGGFLKSYKNFLIQYLPYNNSKIVYIVLVVDVSLFGALQEMAIKMNPSKLDG